MKWNEQDVGLVEIKALVEQHFRDKGIFEAYRMETKDIWVIGMRQDRDETQDVFVSNSIIYEFAHTITFLRVTMLKKVRSDSRSRPRTIGLSHHLRTTDKELCVKILLMFCYDALGIVSQPETNNNDVREHA